MLMFWSQSCGDQPSSSNLVTHPVSVRLDRGEGGGSVGPRLQCQLSIQRSSTNSRDKQAGRRRTPAGEAALVQLVEVAHEGEASVSTGTGAEEQNVLFKG